MIALLLLFLSAIQTSHAQLIPRIVGGTDADPTRYPYFTKVQIGSDGTFCGGNLIAEDIVLTAGHCLLQGREYVIFVNSTENQELTGYEYQRSVVDLRRHPNYMANAVTERNDLLLLKLNKPVLEVTPVSLNRDDSVPFDKEELSVVGLGRLSDTNTMLPRKLQVVNVFKVSFDDCNSQNSFNGDIIDSEMICAGVPSGKKDACFGDSGGPLILANSNSSEFDLLVGTVSFGEGCGNPNFPGGYVRISAYVEWIEQQICHLSAFRPEYCTYDSFAPSTQKPSTLTPVTLQPITSQPVSPRPATNAPVTPSPIGLAHVTLFPSFDADLSSEPPISELGPESAYRCGDCYCIPNDGVCPIDQPGISQSFSDSEIALYESFAPLNTISLQTASGQACYPFAGATGPLDPKKYPESSLPQCKRPPPNGFCAFVFQDDNTEFENNTACRNREYFIETFQSEEDVPPNAAITHRGACGVCSSAQDLAVRMKYIDSFQMIVQVCTGQYLLLGRNLDAAQDCYEEVGFGSDCARLWAHYSALESLLCADECANIAEIPFNGPPPSCPKAECFQCTDEIIWRDFDRIAGRTMPGSGIVEEIAHPCSSYYPVVHDPCPIAESSPSSAPIDMPFPTFCFSGEARVEVKNKGTILMKDLKRNDFVLTGPNRYERVYSFGHYNVRDDAKFWRFEPSKLELSSNHMVFVISRGPLPASMVQKGDILAGGQTVESISQVARQGMYAPFTPSGIIVVNGIKSSCYVAFQGSDKLMVGNSFSTGISYHWLAHMSQAPHRIWCYHLGRCQTENYSGAGISMMVYQPHRLALTILRLPASAMMLLILPALLCFTCFFLIECIVAFPALVFILLLLAGVLTRLTRRLLNKNFDKV